MCQETLEEVERQLRKIAKIRSELEGCLEKTGNLRSSDLAKYAKKLGRTQRKSRSRHIVFENDDPNAPELPIPSHSKPLGKGLAKKIVNTLLGDADLQKDKLEEMKNKLLNQKDKVDHENKYE